MKIAYKHLLRFLVDEPDIEDLSSRLFQLGHEHEVNDSIFDIEFTPNRGDCLSLKGLSRDLNVFYKTNLDLPIYKNALPTLDINFVNNAEDKCPYISFLNIEINGHIKEYKGYLEDYFTDLKINKNNFFTDISNYIAYEMGQPTHCYEFSSIENDITLKENNINSKFTTLFGNNLNITDHDLVFTSNEKVINLSGIVGGIDTACSKNTKNALIECAYFIPESIVGKSIKYNLHSDASHKFERGTDPKCHEEVLRRFIQIISEHAEINKIELFRNTHFLNNNDAELEFDLDRVNKILGISATKNYYKNTLAKLGFEVDKTIKIPSYRSDIRHQNDLAEELARVIGYDNIPINSISLKPRSIELQSSKETLLKQFLVNNGFAEVINAPFCPDNYLDSIQVDNPLDNNRKYLRTNIIDSLVTNLIYNEKRQKDMIKLFEISDIYTSKKNIQEKRVAIIVSGRRGQNYKDFSKKLDNKYLSELFNTIDINIDKSILSIDRNKLDTKIKTPIFYMELKLNDLTKYFDDSISINPTLPSFVKYIPISEYPSSYRDLSFSVKDSSKIEEVIKSILDIKSTLIKHSFIFDFYENKKIDESKIGFRFIFQSDIQTLTDDEIDKEIKEIIESVLTVNSVSLPGFIQN